MGVFIAVWLRLFFRKYPYNFFEVLILLCFVMGMGMLILAVFALIQGLTGVALMTAASIIAFAYCAWAIAQFYDKKRPVNYVKSFASYMLGMVSFMLLAIVLGTFIDFIKH
jgi:hypothetical protein